MKESPAFTNSYEDGGRIHYLIACFIKGTLTAMERKELDEWILSSDENELLFDQLTTGDKRQKTLEEYESQERVLQRIRKRISFTPEKRRRVVSLSFISVAASLVIIVSVVLFFLMEKGDKKKSAPDKAMVFRDPLPGKNIAILTLANGKRVALDSSAPRTLEEGSITVDNGSISYEKNGEAPLENILSTPRGGQYKVVLPDGTKVWLNAESSLKYTTVFTGNERTVSLVGEGYFEVVENKEKPFIVESSAGRIKVLGTHFNVNSYGDENVGITTLLQGSVEIKKGSNTSILKPGEQARTTENKIDVVPVEAKLATAWKDGEFVFRNTPVIAIVRQLARWYQLDVEFRDPVEKHLNGIIKSDVPLSKVLHYLEETGDVHFKLEGMKLIVLK